MNNTEHEVDKAYKAGKEEVLQELKTKVEDRLDKDFKRLNKVEILQLINQCHE